MVRALSISSGGYANPNARPSTRQIDAQSLSAAVRTLIDMGRVWSVPRSVSQ